MCENLNKKDRGRLVEISGRGRQEVRKMQPGKETVTQRMGRVSERTERNKERESHLEEVNKTIGEQKTN